MRMFWEEERKNEGKGTAFQKEDYDRWRSYQSPSAENRVQVCWDPELKEEADQLVVEESKAGKPTVNHLWNKSKDMSDSVANALWYLTNFELINTKLRYTGVKVV